MDADQEQSISANLFGQSVAAKGTSGIIILVLLGLSVSLMYLLDKRSTDTEMSIAKGFAAHSVQMNLEHASIISGLKDIKEVNESISESLKVQNFLILADERKRREIKDRLDVPDSLRKKGF